MRRVLRSWGVLLSSMGLGIRFGEGKVDDMDDMDCMDNGRHGQGTDNSYRR